VQQSALRFFARAVRAEDGGPVVGARAAFLDGPAEAPAAVSGPEGELALELPGEDVRPASLEAPGFGRLLFTTDALHSDPDSPAILHLRSGAGLRAHVLAAGGGGVPDVEVLLRAEPASLAASDGLFASPFLFGEQGFSGRTDASGFAELRDLPPGAPLAVELRAGEGPPVRVAEPINLVSGERAERVWTLGAGATIRGRVIEAGGPPVAEAEVWRLHGGVDLSTVLRLDQRSSVLQKARTDRAGAFELTEVPPGRWWVGVAPSDQYAGVAATATVEPTTLEVEVELLVHPGLFLRGVVLDPEGRPAADVRVVAHQEGSIVYYDENSPDAEFSLGPVVPGTYLIGAGTAGGLLRASEEISAEAGDEDIVLRLQPGGFLRGRVVDAETGEPVAAAVRATPTDAERKLPALQGSRPHAVEFELGGLPPVEHALVARTSDGRVAVLRALPDPVLESAVRHELRVAPGATLVLDVAEGAAGGVFAVWSEDALIAASGLPVGGRAEIAVPAGEVVVSWRPRGEREFEEHRATGAAASVVELELGPR
jgi:hypothetical protein